jgi:hypothetical protein
MVKSWGPEKVGELAQIAASGGIAKESLRRSRLDNWISR